jgi:dihydroxyacid dehydratase/phosphogluconate dehydratase
MLHLRRAGLLDTSARTVAGESLSTLLDWWEDSPRRHALRQTLKERDGVDPDNVIMGPGRARERGLTATVCFPLGNLTPGGSVIKATAIDPAMAGADGVYRMTGRARVFTSESAAVAAIQSHGEDRVQAGDVIVMMARGPMGSGMEETYQVTSALKMLDFGKHVAVVTDARFSGVSTGACVGHVTPEALAGGPIGKVSDGDWIEIVVDRIGLDGSVNLVGEGERRFSAEEGAEVLARRPAPVLEPDPGLPADTRLWAALQEASGGSWGGAVFDAERILGALRAARAQKMPGTSNHLAC